LGAEKPTNEVPFRISGQSAFKQGKQPSAYMQNFLKSNFKQQSLNDSLDKLQREFMIGY
jgi:hypothetical protein